MVTVGQEYVVLFISLVLIPTYKVTSLLFPIFLDIELDSSLSTSVSEIGAVLTCSLYAATAGHPLILPFHDHTLQTTRSTFLHPRPRDIPLTSSDRPCLPTSLVIVQGPTLKTLAGQELQSNRPGRWREVMS
jgi:hypothetical protein